MDTPLDYDFDPCALCGHPEHSEHCEQVTGYDHLNGDYECGCHGVPAPDSRVSIHSQSADTGYWQGKNGTVRAAEYTPPGAEAPLGDALIGLDPPAPDVVWVEVDGERDDDEDTPYAGIYAFHADELAPIEDEEEEPADGQ